MAKTFTYQIAVELTNDTQSDVKKILGKFAKEVNKNTITIEFDPEMDTKGLMKKIEEIQKNVPEITVQVKYDILEKATEQAKAKLKELQKGADLSILEDSLKKATAEFDNLYKEFKGNNSHKRELNELAKTISSITTALGESPKGKTILSQLPKDVQDTINKLERLEAFERSINSAQPIHIVSEEEIKKQMNLIAELEGKLTELENQGASPRKTTDLSQIRRQMEEVSALVNEKLQIQVDNTSAVQNIEQVNELLKALEEKQVTVRITGTNTVAEKMGKFVEEFKSIVQQMESAFGGEVLSSKGKAGLEASIKVIQKVREEEKTLQSSLKEMNADLDKSLNVTSDSNLEGKIESLVKQVQTAKRGLKNISLGIEIDEAKKAKFLADLKNLSDILNSIPSEKDIHINVITDGEDKAQKLIYSEEQLEEGFTKLQAIAKQFGNFNLTKNVDKEAFANLLDQYQKYVNYGGKRPIEDLTESSKAAEKLSKAYAELAGQAGVAKQEAKNLNNEVIKEEQMTPVKVKVEPEIDPQEFADKVTNLLSEVSAKIKVSGIFADNVDSNLSSLKSLSDINISGDGFNALNKLLNNLANNKDDRIKNLVDNLTKIREVLNANLGKNSLVRVLQDMVNQTEGLKSLVSILKDYEKTQKVIETVKTAQTNPNEIFEVNQQYIQEWDKYINEREKYLAIGEKQAKQVAEEAKKSAKETEESIKKITSAFEELDKKGLSQYAQSDINKLKNDFAGVQAEIQKVGAANISDESKNKINEIAEELKNVKANATEASKSFKQLASSSDIDSMMNKMQNWLSSNKKLSDSTRQAVQNLMSTLNLGSTTKEQLSGISKEFANIQRNAKAAGETGRTFFDIWKQGMTNVVRYLSTFTSIYRIIGYVRESLTTIKDLDYALVDLRKTAHMTSTEFEQFYLSSNNVAKQMGVTTQAIIEQASSWSRLGYNTAETASAMAALSSQFASISPGMETDTAQTGLVSIMKAWDVDVDRVKRDIMDNINTLGNNFALTNEDIIQGMERAGATLSAIGMDIQSSFALFTGAQEVIQNAETVGTAIKTLSLRIRGYDEETEELSDDVVAATGKVADLTKVASNNFAGVSLWADAAQTEYRSLVDYLGDIAEIWDEIDAKSRTQLLENLFGKRGASVGSAILGNFEQVRSALEAMEEAAGSSDREMGIVEQSIEYKLNALKQTWVGTLQNIIDRGDLGKIVDGLTAISEVLGNIVSVLGMGGTLATGGGIIASIFAIKDFNNIVNKFREFSAIGKAINVLNVGMKGMAGHKRLVEELAKATSILTAEKTAELLATKGLDAQLIKDVLIKQGVSEETIQAVLANTAFTASEEGATVGAFSLSAALKGLWASFAPFIVGGAIIAGFAAIATVIHKTKEANDELKKSAQELGEQYNSSKEDLESYKEEIEKLRETVSDSSASYEETREARERLLEIQDELIDKYGDERNAINDITEAVNGSSEAFDRLANRQWQEARNEFNEQNLKGIDWLNRAIHGADDNIGVMLSEMEDVSRVVRGTSGDFEALNKAASALGYTVSFDEATSQIEVTADNAYDLYERLLDVQKILEDNGASSKTLSTLNNQITGLKEAISEYDDFYNQYIVNERILGNETGQSYEEEWVEWREAYNDYREAVKEGNEELAENNKENLLSTYAELQDEIQARVHDADDSLTEVQAQSILQAFKDVMPELQNEFGNMELKASLFVDVDGSIPDKLVPLVEEVEQGVLGIQRGEQTVLSGIGNKLVEDAKQFTDAEQLLSMATENVFETATSSQQEAYRELERRASSFHISVMELLEVLNQYNALGSKFFMSKELKSSIGNLTLRASNSQQATAERELSDYASKLDAEEQNVWIKFAQSYQGNWWNFIKDFEAELERIRAEVANEDLFDSMSITETVESINTQLKPALDSLGDVYTQVLSAPNELIEGSLGSIDLIEQVEKIKKELDSLNEIDGIEVDYVPFEHLVEVLQDTSSTGKEVQDAFNGVATSITNVGIEGTESIRTLVEALSDFGVTNAAEVAVGQMMENTEALKQAGLDLQQISADLDVSNKEQLNSTYALIDAWGEETLGAANTAEAMALLKMQVILLNQNPLDESASISELMRLAGVAGVATTALQELAAIQSKIAGLSIELDNAIADNNSAAAAHVIQEIAMLQAKAEQVKTRVTTEVQDAITASYTNKSATKAAGGAGKDAGKSYVDGFKDELSKLKEQYDNGEIDLQTYLAKYRDLIEKYFHDTEKYAEERAQALHDYLEELKGYYDAAISGVTTLIDHKIKGVQKEKDAALKAIEAERKAATEAYEKRIEEIDKVIKQKNKEIKQYEKVIKQLEKQKKVLEKQKKEYEKQKTLIQKNSIDPLQKEIDLIQKANNERDRQLQLQKDLYELERLQNQRTQFIYKDGQMVYQNDPEAARQQREQVNKDEQEDQVAKLEKQIELYETQIEQIEHQQELIDEQIEKLDEQIEIYQEIIEGINEEISALEEEKEAIQETLDEINKFYDELKASTEEYFDSLIESLEETKSKWEELAEIDKIASAWKDVGGIMEGLGYSVEDVLNDVPGAFDAFKEAYIETLVGLNGGNEEYLRGLSEVTGKSVDELKKMGGAAKDAATEAKEPLEDVGKSIEDVGTKAGTATGNVDGLATSTGALATSAGEASTNLGDVDEKVGNIADKSAELDSVKSSFNELRNALQAINSYTNLPEIAEAIGKTAEGFSTLSTVDLATLGMNFNAIGTALEKCRMALSENEGGVASKMERIGAVDLTNLAVQLASVSNRMQEIATAMSGGETGVPVADSFERISQTAEQFNLLAAALQLCADAVGGGVDDPTGGLVGAINSLNEITFEEGLIAQFTKLKESVDAVTTALGGSAGGGEEGESGGGGKKQQKSQGKTEGSGGNEEGGGDTLTSALENVQSVAETTIGTQAITEEGSEGDGTVIGDFGALATTVGTARNAIGLGETEGEATLIGAVQNLGVIDNDVMRGGEGGEGGVIGDWNEFNEILGQAEEHITAMVKGLESLKENYSTTLTVTLEIEGDAEYTGTATRGNRKGHYSFNILDAIGLPSEGGEWEGAVGHRKKQGKAHLSGTAKWGGDWAYDGGSTLISEIGPELVVFPDGHFEVFDKPQMVDLPKGSVIFNHLQTDEILDTKNQVHHLSKGSANANGTLGMTPLSIANPEQFEQLMQTAELLKVNTGDMAYSLGDIQYATDDIKKAVESITNNNTNNANITFGDLYFQLNGITSEEVMSEVGNALEKEFSGLALNAYQRAMKH